MRKIVFLINEFKYSGIQNQVVNLTNSLADIYKLDIVVLKKLCDVKLNKKISISELDIKKTFLNIGEEKAQAREINKKIEDADVVVFNDISIAKLYDRLNLNDKYTVYWMHNYFDDVSLLKKFDKVVIPNESVLNKLNLDNSIYIPNTIEISNNVCDYKTNNKLVFVGNLSKSKGIDLLIDMMSYLVKTNKTAVLNIIGDGMERASILEKIKSSGLTNNIYLLGSFSKNELLDELRDSSVFVTLSLNEMFNLPVLEAMGVGLPVVAFESDSVNALITDEIDGMIVKNKDIYKMSTVVNELLNDSVLRRNVGGCALEKSRNFDVNVINRDWIKLFK